jgi:hypothetical protein
VVLRETREIKAIQGIRVPREIKVIEAPRGTREIEVKKEIGVLKETKETWAPRENLDKPIRFLVKLMIIVQS